MNRHRLAAGLVAILVLAGASAGARSPAPQPGGSPPPRAEEPKTPPVAKEQTAAKPTGGSVDRRTPQQKAKDAKAAQEKTKVPTAAARTTPNPEDAKALPAESTAPADPQVETPPAGPGGGELASPDDGNSSSTQSTDPPPRSWLEELASLPGLLAGVAIVLGLMGLALWVVQEMELRSVQSALKGKFPEPSPSGRDGHWQSLFLRMVSGMEQMQRQIDELEQRINQLQAKGPVAAPSGQPSQSQSSVWFDKKGDSHVVRDAGRESASEHHEEKSRPAFPPPPPPLRRSFSNDDAAIASLSRDPQLQQLMQDYNRTAQVGRAQIVEFINRHHPKEVSIVGEGALVAGDDDILWFIALPNSDYGVVVPGGSPIRDWHKSYRTMMGQQARERFGPLYEVLDGPDMLVEQPAWAREGDGRYQIVKSGVLRGVLKSA